MDDASLRHLTDRYARMIGATTWGGGTRTKWKPTIFGYGHMLRPYWDGLPLFDMNDAKIFWMDISGLTEEECRSAVLASWFKQQQFIIKKPTPFEEWKKAFG